ncbi:hypothetical protein TrLO_g15228 [Triparma laevis f. longispina]|uniref:Uncharacterized protein n=1 Tax=Triparma laevis f. longispina TaxID=1714387 RepID=A0A9W6ZQP9_9STRA|nr:hypothetical protein TrLO_g15228 [Triparma laevis f. longispina]
MDPSAGKGMGKMFVMLPVMLYARKLDSEDPNTVLLIRVAYGIVQVITFIALGLTYNKLSSLKDPSQTVYIEKAKSFMEDPAAPKKFTKGKKKEVYSSKFNELLSSSCMGVLMTCGLHYYKGMVMGLAIQCVMGPFNLYDNAVIGAMLWGKADIGELKELTEEMTLIEVDDAGKETVVREGKGGEKKEEVKKIKEEMPQELFEELLLDTWDQAGSANLKPLIQAVSKKSVKHTTREFGWTPLMVFCGLGGAVGFEEGIRKCVEMGADIKVKDEEGWTALHWCAYHGNASAVEVLKETCGIDSVKDIKDKEGKTVQDLCVEEKNDDVWEVIKGGKKGGEEGGLKKRK